MKRTEKLSLVEWMEQEFLKGELSMKDILEQAKEKEQEERKKRETQFVLVEPFNITPLTREVGTIYDGIKQTEVKNIGYVIKDASGFEYFFYEKDGILEYDGWSRELKPSVSPSPQLTSELKTTKED
jgi:hypothetical protein